MKHVVGTSAWALLWTDREIPHLEHANLVPALFKTRREAREYAVKHHGYIRTRKDLRGPPFNWRMPRAIVVSVTAIVDAAPGGKGER